MRFTMTVEMDNAAFEVRPRGELARILMRAAEQVAAGETERRTMDSNGNSCGEWSVTA